MRFAVFNFGVLLGVVSMLFISTAYPWLIESASATAYNLFVSSKVLEQPAKITLEGDTIARIGAGVEIERSIFAKDYRITLRIPRHLGDEVFGREVMGRKIGVLTQDTAR